MIVRLVSRVEHRQEGLHEWHENVTAEVLRKRASMLVLSYNRIQSIPDDLSQVASLLYTLNMNHNLLTDAGAAPLQQLTNLTALDLSHNELTQATFLMRLPNIKNLNLSFNDLGSLELPLANPQRLLTLTLHHANNGVPRSLPHAMLLQIPQIQSLDLGYNDIVLNSEDMVSRTFQFDNLLSLSLSGARLTGFSDADFIAAATRLEHLYLEDCTDMLVAPRGVEYLSRLRSLSFSRCSRLTRISLYPETHGSTLRYLDLSDCNLKDVSEQLAELTQLRQLRLHGNTHLGRLPANIERLSLLRNLALNVNGWHAQFFQQGMLQLAAVQQRRDNDPHPPIVLFLDNPRTIAAILNKWSSWFALLGRLEQRPILQMHEEQVRSRRQHQIEQWNDANLLEVDFGESLGKLHLSRRQAFLASVTLASQPWDGDYKIEAPTEILIQAARLPPESLYYYVSDMIYGVVLPEEDLASARLFVTSEYWRVAAARFLLRVVICQRLQLRFMTEPTPLQVLERLFVYWVTHPLDEADEFPTREIFDLMRGVDMRPLSEIRSIYSLFVGWFGE